MMEQYLTFITGLTLCLLLSQPSAAARINAPHAIASNETSARGVLRASETTEITATMSETLLELPYKLGDYVKAGALIAKFDCALQEAQMTALIKKHRTYHLKYRNAAELYKYNAAGKLDVNLAEAEMQHALAETDVLQTQLQDCTIYAPFSSYVTARHSSAYETPQRGQKLYSLDRAKSAELSIIVPSTWMKWIKKGQALEFTVDATDEIIEAEIIRIGASVDPVSQTLEIIAKPAKRSLKTLPGMSGLARFKDAP